MENVQKKCEKKTTIETKVFLNGMQQTAAKLKIKIKILRKKMENVTFQKITIQQTKSKINNN